MHNLCIFKPSCPAHWWRLHSGWGGLKVPNTVHKWDCVQWLTVLVNDLEPHSPNSVPTYLRTFVFYVLEEYKVPELGVHNTSSINKKPSKGGHVRGLFALLLNYWFLLDSRKWEATIFKCVPITEPTRLQQTVTISWSQRYAWLIPSCMCTWVLTHFCVSFRTCVDCSPLSMMESMISAFLLAIATLSVFGYKSFPARFTQCLVFTALVLLCVLLPCSFPILKNIYINP